jgi:hypothetical protein
VTSPPANSVIPEHACPLCGDTGWITCLDLDGESAYEMACPEGCPSIPLEWNNEAEEPY